MEVANRGLPQGSNLTEEERAEGIKRARAEEGGVEGDVEGMEVGVVKLGLIEQWVQEVVDAMPVDTEGDCSEEDLAWDDVHGGALPPWIR